MINPYRTARYFTLLLLCALTLPLLHAGQPATAEGSARSVIGVQQKENVKVVFQMTSGDTTQNLSKMLKILDATHRNYIEEGILPQNLSIRAVIHGDAADYLLTDAAWNKYKQQNGGNPNTALIEALTKKGVIVELCNSRRVQNGWEKDDIHPDVILVGNAYHRIADLQYAGYAYIRP